jgi:hypothetical protein
LTDAFRKVVDSISRDMPLLMHGSGDVPPAQVNPATVDLISALTAQYVGRLVDAAIDSHDMLRDVSHDQPVVPPRIFARSRKPPAPPPPPVSSSKRPRASDDCWDEPLPEPKIRGKNSNTDNQDKKSDDDDNDEVHVDDWVGAAGVDLWEESRARTAYVSGNAALSTQSFIFPICHDVYAYGRVTEVQAVSRAVAPLLLDPVLMEMVRTEGKVHHAAVAQKRKKKKAAAGNTSDPEDDDDENAVDDDDDDRNVIEEEGPAWPGLESLLPVHAYLT